MLRMRVTMARLLSYPSETLAPSAAEIETVGARDDLSGHGTTASVEPALFAAFGKVSRVTAISLHTALFN